VKRVCASVLVLLLMLTLVGCSSTKTRISKEEDTAAVTDAVTENDTVTEDDAAAMCAKQKIITRESDTHALRNTRKPD